MKRLASSDPLAASFMSICPNPTDEHNDNEGVNNPIYSGEFQSTILDGPDEGEICVEKKRRLRLDQVKALEKNFEVENKLEPERKMKLAEEIGLRPRQVAVWFQNRRARWKTKQLERDYGVLKANYDALSHNYESLQRDNETLLKEIREIKSKLNEDDIKAYIKEEPLLSETEEKSKLDETHIKSDNEEDEAATELDFVNRNGLTMGNALIFTDHFKDGFSDSDSSAILNDQQSPIIHHIHNGSSSSSSMNISCFKFSGLNSDPNKNCYYQTQFVKIEEHNFESCSSLFTDDQAPTLHWYTSEEWN